MKKILSSIFRKLFRSRQSPSQRHGSDFDPMDSPKWGKKFPASIPRSMYWSNAVGGTKVCPRCHSELEKEYQVYVVAVRTGGEIEPFMTGNDDGYFCPKCPVVVLDREAFAAIPAATINVASSFDIAVAGIVDMDAIPEDKKGIPLGDDGNPIPLVEFTNTSSRVGTPRKRKSASRKGRKKPRRKK